MSKRRCGVGVAVLNDLLYAVGGHDGQSYLNSIERCVSLDPLKRVLSILVCFCADTILRRISGHVMWRRQHLAEQVWVLRF